MWRAIRRSILWLLVLGLVLGVVLWRDMQAQLGAPMRVEAPAIIELPPGSGLAHVISQLEAGGHLQGRAPLYLRLHARLRGLDAALHAGEYELKPGLTPLAFLGNMVAGRTKLHEVLIVEGWTFAQALAAMRAQPALSHTLVDATPEALMAAIGRAGQHPEGRLFPDTYRFARGTRDVDFLRRAAEAMDRALAEEWAARAADLPYASPEEALTMASIVEKETGAPSERAQIAGVFVRRLRLGMRLQTDPTVIYGLGSRFDGNLRRIDLDTDAPYNTYQRAGLPPTPICLPGRAAIHAALHPAPGQSLFFVARGDGTHQFSDTLEQHDAAVQRYQLRRR